MIRKLLFILLAVSLLAGCKRKKPSLSGDEPVEVGDFIESFEPVKPPLEFTDSTLNRKEKDSLLISYKVFTQFVPDTVLTKVFGKNAKPKLYPLKRTGTEDKEIYLFAKAVLAEKKVVFVFVFGKDNRFVASMPLLRPDASSSTRQVSGMDKSFSVYKTIFVRRPDGSTGEGKEVYAFNAAAGQFILIMTDALDEKVKEIINPIDTLPRKHKFSADYVKDKMNLVSIRDGSRAGRITFFIHFEKEGGACTGELKGDATFTSAGTAVYRQPGDACVLQLHFTSSSVSLKELEACGSRRGVKCSFDGIYPRKKETKKKAVKAIKKG